MAPSRSMVLGTLTLGILVSLGRPGHAADAPRPPNVVFILADDLGYGELGCYGQKKIKTPNLDRLAAEGMRFTQHYSGSPVCAPLRCVLMTGLHPGHALVRTNLATPPEEQYPLPAGTVTLARLLKDRGYATGAFGKWGLGGPGSTGVPQQQGFERFFGYLCQGTAHNFYPTYLWDHDRRVELKNPAMKLPDKLPEGADPKDPASYKVFSGKGEEKGAGSLFWTKRTSKRLPTCSVESLASGAC